MTYLSCFFCSYLRDGIGTVLYTVQYSTHCPKSILNLCIKTEPVTAGAEATVYVLLLFTYTYVWPRNQAYYVPSAPTGSGWVFMRRLRLILGQSTLLEID